MTLNIDDIARLAGVSRSTVSRVLNNHVDVSDKTRAKIRQIIEEHDYNPNSVARALARQKTQVLSLVIPQVVTDVFSEPYNATVIQHVTQTANAMDYAILLWMGNDNPAEESRFFDRILHSSHVDGLIVISSVEGDQIANRLLQLHLPFILIGPPFADDINYINADNFDGVYKAVSHLITLGWDRIGIITGPTTLRVTHDRVRGYEMAMRDHDRPVDRSLVVEGGYGESHGYRQMTHLLEMGVDAVFVSSDVMALGALRAAQDAGRRVPDDLGIVGFDDLPIAQTSNPPLTTVRQPIVHFGVLAAQALIGILEDELPQPYQKIIPTELVVRKTCGA